MTPRHEKQEVKKPVQTLEHALAIDDDGTLPPPALEDAPKFSPARSRRELHASAELCASM